MYILKENELDKPFSSVQFSSVAQSCPNLCDPMECSTPGFPVHHQTLWACSNSHPLRRWCHPTISSFVVPFSSCLQSLPVSRSCLMSQLFTLGGQSIRASWASALASVLPVNIQGWSPLGWTGWISLQSKDSQDTLKSSPTPQFKSVNYRTIIEKNNF